MIKGTQRNANNSTSTVDYQRSKVFLGSNSFSNGNLKSASAITVKNGTPLFRAADGTLTVTVDWSKFVGILSLENDIELAANTPVNVTYCDKGKVNARGVILPSGKTMESVESGSAIKDYIQHIGIHVDTTTRDFTKFDN